MLQTARGIIINTENIRIFFDSGSRKYFINESLSRVTPSNNKREKGFEAF